MQEGYIEPRLFADESVHPAKLTILYHHRTRSRDGQSIHIDEFIKALRADGHSVIVVEPKRIPALKLGIEKKLLPKSIYELIELAFSVVEFIKLLNAAKKHRPDALYQRANVFMLSGAWLARALRLPFLLEVNAPLAEERNKFGGLAWPRLGAWTEHHLWRSADMVLPVTKVLARMVAKAGVPETRITVIPNGVDVQRFKPSNIESAKQHLGITGLTLGFAGYIREWHGLEQVIDLLANDVGLADAHFLVIGDGPARASLEKRASSLGIAHRVTITGVVSREDLPNYLGAVDIALQPEVTPYASPLKIFEYMALKLAIVAPATENILEILDHERDALLFSHGDMESFSTAITRLATNAPLRARLGEAAAAKIVARDCTWGGNARKVVSMITQLS